MVVGAEQTMQAYALPASAQTDVVIGQALSQAPQLVAVVTFVSHPWSGLELQWLHPAAHEESGNEHCPDAEHVTGPLTCGRPVQS